MRKNFIIEVLWLLVLVIVLAVSGFVIELFVITKNYFLLLFLLCCWGIAIVGHYFVKINGFEAKNISPYIYSINTTFTIFDGALNLMERTYGKVEYINDNTSAVYVKKKGLNVTFIFLECYDSLNKELLKERKIKANRQIKRQSKYSNLTNQNRLKIYVIFVKQFNHFCNELVGINADIGFSRVESELNVVISENEAQLMMPAHFRISGFMKYYKAQKIIEDFITIA